MRVLSLGPLARQAANRADGALGANKEHGERARPPALVNLLRYVSVCKMRAEQLVMLVGGCDNQNTGRRFAMATSSESVIVRDPEILSGQPVFRGTRVPFQALLDYLEGGDTLDEFLEQYPGVTREQAIAALEEAKALVLARFEK